jgi:hypothetical protein
LSVSSVFAAFHFVELSMQGAADDADFFSQRRPGTKVELTTDCADIHGSAKPIDTNGAFYEFVFVSVNG